MYHMGDWFKLTVVMLGSASISIVFLITAYTRIAYEEGGAVPTEIVELLEQTKDLNNPAVENNEVGNPGKNFEKTTMSKKQQGTKCRKLMMIVAKRMMKVLNTCNRDIKEIYPDKKDFLEHFQCTVKCFMTKVKMIDAEGKFTRATFNVFMDEQIPSTYHDYMEDLADSCIKAYETKITGYDDPFCITYGDFVKCLQDNVAGQC